MLLSIVFITRDRKEVLLKAIESCIERKIDSMEIIVLDNSSKEQATDMLSVEQYLSIKSIPYKIIKAEENLGVSGGRATAFRHAQGKYVFFFDDDALWVSRDPFIKLCNVMERNPKIAAISVKAYEKGTERYLVGPLAKGTKVDVCGEVLSYVGCGHMLRRDAFSDAQLYPPRLGYGSEELYASLRAWSKGYSVFYAADIEMLHLRSSINRINDDLRDFNIITNTYIIRRLLFPVWVLPLETLLCHLRLINNNLYNRKWRNQFKEALLQRSGSDNNTRMNSSVLWGLIRKFGFLSVI